jgi:UDP-2,4-diacetamido-2,4,6-trideoxy-beta-L-altropyranose hydrolase
MGTELAAGLLLRTDGGPEIGGGHVMRCLALAQAWAEEGGRAAFASASIGPALRDRVSGAGFSCHDMAASPGSADDAAATIELASDFGTPLVVVDGYHFSTRFRVRLQEAGLKVAAIDDNGEIGESNDDLVIAYGRHAPQTRYVVRSDRTRLLLGTDYVLLRREFRLWSRQKRDARAAVGRVLVTLGSADPNNVTADVIQAIAGRLPPEVETTVILGGNNRHSPEVTRRIAGLPRFRVEQEVGDRMPALMAVADLAISACGSTVWELLYMGLPFVGIVIVDNQRRGGSALGHDGFPILDSAAVPKDLPDAVADLMADAPRRLRLSDLGPALVDGRGCERVCRFLNDLVSNGR